MGLCCTVPGTSTVYRIRLQLGLRILIQEYRKDTIKRKTFYGLKNWTFSMESLRLFMELGNPSFRPKKKNNAILGQKN
jgi:hypothetical protein